MSGGLSYYFIRKYQAVLYEDRFLGVTQDHFKSTKKSFELLLQANDQVATIMGWACPYASDWPNCAMSSKEFLSRASSLLALSNIQMFAVSPIVRPDHRLSFEKFALEYYQSDGGYPNGTGTSKFASGIFDYDENYIPKRSPNHTNPTQFKYDILVPVFLTTSPTISYFLANTYSDPVLEPTLDEILDCLNTSTPYFKDGTCNAITDFLPAAASKFSVIASPIFPALEPDPNVVGISGAMFSWETLLSTSAQHDSDFQCSVRSDSSPVIKTYKIQNGVAHETTKIVSFSPSVDRFWKQSKISFVLDPEGFLHNETKYTITYYSTGDSPSPIFAVICCVCCVGITIFISIIFTFFNGLMKRAALEANMLLDSKRTYVRFVSHEIR